ncbi:hypothetical protein PT974_08903 [Cladobotryum mycophilum]|uniref:SUZ domain-containing protein n=1 Tax=Cladobotryum mycophilum TaxID=491253 RepID=A0ABR0SF79_9HYPO
MSKAGGVPNAWDDDWVPRAHNVTSRDESEQEAPQSSLSRQERIQQHAEANRKLWQSADSSQETFHYIEANTGGVPLTTNFKPQVKVLSRKPVIAKRGDPASGMSKLSLDDDDDGKAEVQLTPEEIRAKQKKERDEKQRRYDEARAKIFGESAPSSRGSSPGTGTGTVTPPRSDGRNSQQGRGRGRGGGYRNNSNNAAPSKTDDQSTSRPLRESFLTQILRQNQNRVHAGEEAEAAAASPRGTHTTGRAACNSITKGTGWQWKRGLRLC